MTVPATEIPSRPVPRVARELAASSGFLLARLGFAFKAKAIARIEQAGYEPHHYGVLAIVAEGPPETQATIAQALALDPSRLVAVLDSLERRGLVERRRDQQDRRRHVVGITADGQRELERLRAVVTEIEDEFFGALSNEDRGRFHDLLSQLACAHDPRCAFSPKPD